MYIKHNYSFKIMLSWTWRSIIWFFFIALIPVLLYDIFYWKWLSLPWLPLGLIGTALAFITGFKNNAAYDRTWEARQIYGTIINSSRKFVLMINDYITPELATPPIDEQGLFPIRKKLVNGHIAWLTCLRHMLRQTRPWEEGVIFKADTYFRLNYQVYELIYTLEDDLKKHLSKEELEYVMIKTNGATACLKLQSNYLKELKWRGYIEEFRHIEMEKIIGELVESQGKVERIKNFPYPRQFATLNLFLVWIFIFLLPLGIMSEFERIGMGLRVNDSWGVAMIFIRNHFVWFTLPFNIIVSWIFYTMERIGDITENPFVGLANDVPITTISRGIEIEMLELIGEEEKNIPEPIPTEFNIQM